MIKSSAVVSTFLFGVLFLISFYPTDTEAVPAFVSKTGKSCTYCHNAWPQLNEKGRAFKELGFRISTEDDQTLAELLTEGRFPIGAMLKARPYDKRDSGDRKLRALHEFELFFAGRVGEKWSAYVEIEAEDETGFEPEVSPVVLSYHHNPAVNIQFVWGPYLFADPYGFLGDNYRLTRGRPAVVEQIFGGADGSLSSTRQSMNIYGRPVKPLFYTLGVGGESQDAVTTKADEGTEAENIFGRLAFDVTNDIMIGAFGVKGKNNTEDRAFSRYGMDFQADLGNTRLQAAVVRAADDNAGVPGEAENTAHSIQLTHIFTRGESRMPTWVPLARYDSYEKADGSQEYNELTLHMSYFFDQNVKGFVEYWEQLDVPTGLNKDNRLTLQLAVGF